MTEIKFFDVLAGASSLNDYYSFLLGNKILIFLVSIVTLLIVLIIFLLAKNRIKEGLIRREFVREKHFRQRIIDTAEAMIVTLNPQAGIETFNRFAEELTGYKRRELKGRDWYSIFLPGDKEAKDLFYKILAAEDDYHRNENKLFDKMGNKHIISWQNSCLRDEKGKVEALLAVGIDITEQRRAEKDLEFRTYHDSLTDLYNMKYFRERAEIELELARRNQNILAVLLLDLDRFKLINDTYGHQTGNDILKTAAVRLKELLGKDICLARMGGDEFIALLPDVDRVEDLMRTALDILTYIKKAMGIRGREYSIEASIGISFYPDDGETVEILISNADTALLRAKELGKDNYQLFNYDMSEQIVDRLYMENNLKRALELGELTVYYQPVVELETGRIEGAEALVRWDSPEEGLIPPGRFIPLAEENGMIINIDRVVLNETCRQAKLWFDQGYTDLKFSVNLSARHFSHLNIVEEINEILTETGYEKNRLVLELTESAAVKNFMMTISCLEDLREMGIEIYLDDFGTGYSSLNYLTSFPFDALKIDRSFITDLETADEDPAIVAAIIAMAHQLGLKVVAEGIETEEQLEFLEQHKCDLGQGYYFSQPLPAAEFKKLLKDN